MENPQTETDIINAMLSAIGDLPVVDLADEEDSVSEIDADVLKARTLLRTVNAELQNRGWWFNTETWELTVDDNSQITMPVNTLRIRNSTRYTKKGTLLYDQTNHTTTIDADSVELDLILGVNYSDMPYSFYSYVKNVACMRFFMNEDGDRDQVSMLSSATTESFRLVQDEDLMFKNPTMFSSNPTVSRVMNGLTSRRE